MRTKRSVSGVLRLSVGILASLISASCTELLGANWDGHAPTAADVPGPTDDGAAEATDAATVGDGASNEPPYRTQSLGLGAVHGCAIDEMARVKCWGSNLFGQTASSSFEAHVVSLPEGATAVAGGQTFACAIGISGTVRCWGSNDSGELGRTGPKGGPEAVDGLTERATTIGARGSSACVTVDSGKVACWGALQSASTKSDRPVAISGLSDGRAVAVGVGFACALRATGEVSCWGANDEHQLGTDEVPTSSGPRLVVLPEPAVDVVAGMSFACAVLASGNVHCWGRNDEGQLGTEPNSSAGRPVAVANVGPVRSLAAGSSHVCAISAGGKVLCWGSPGGGRLGGTPGVEGSVVEVFGLPSIAATDAIGAGGSHSCVKVGTTAPQCWGLNDVSQLGTAGPQGGPAPRAVEGW